MGSFGKWVGGGLGWAFGGPIGAIFGFAVGSMFDNMTVTTGTVDAGVGQTQSGDFVASLLVLTAAVMKADGKVLRSELDFVKSFLTRNFGAANTQYYLQNLKEILNQEIPVDRVCYQIRDAMPHADRLQLMHYLWGIALADGQVPATELDVLQRIAAYLRISSADFDSIKSLYFKDTESAYKILEIDKAASDDEIKKAYRKMAVKYHPDKVSHLGDDIKRSAEEKFKSLNEAYERIKKERGIN